VDKKVGKKDLKMQVSQEDRLGPMVVRNGFIDAKNATLGLLVAALTTLLGRPVLDETGLTAKFNFQLHFDPSSARLPVPAQPSPGASTPSGEASIFTAIQELGLRLESVKRPIEMVVIDSIDRPTGN